MATTTPSMDETTATDISSIQLDCNISVVGRDIKNSKKMNIIGKIVSTELNRITIIQVIIEIIGRAKCSWRPKHENLRQFFLARHSLCNNSDKKERSSNELILTFNCYWPNYYPATWHGQYGEIKYTGTLTVQFAVADKTMPTINGIDTSSYWRHHSEELTFAPTRDLSVERHLHLESRRDLRRNFRLGGGTIYVRLWIPISCLAIGQSLPVLCTIINDSKFHFSGLQIALTQIEIYQNGRRGDKNEKRIRRNICQATRQVYIHNKGHYLYYAVLKTDDAATKHTLTTTIQYSKCLCCQVVYEVRASLKRALVTNKWKNARWRDVDVAGLPIIIGTQARCDYNVIKMIRRAFTDDTIINGGDRCDGDMDDDILSSRKAMSLKNNPLYDLSLMSDDSRLTAAEEAINRRKSVHYSMVAHKHHDSSGE